jgi:hypothetical protein
MWERVRRMPALDHVVRKPIAARIHSQRSYHDDAMPLSMRMTCRISGALLIIGFLLNAGGVVMYTRRAVNGVFATATYFNWERGLLMAAYIVSALGVSILEIALREAKVSVLTRLGCPTLAGRTQPCASARVRTTGPPVACHRARRSEPTYARRPAAYFATHGLVKVAGTIDGVPDRTSFMPRYAGAAPVCEVMWSSGVTVVVAARGRAT